MGSFKRFALAIMVSVSVLACGGDPEPGESCSNSDDCGTLQCYCAIDVIPGVCSETCATDADCASLGDGLSCSKDFCTNTSVCLRK